MTFIRRKNLFVLIVENIVLRPSGKAKQCYNLEDCSDEEDCWHIYLLLAMDDVSPIKN